MQLAQMQERRRQAEDEFSTERVNLSTRARYGKIANFYNTLIEEHIGLEGVREWRYPETVAEVVRYMEGATLGEFPSHNLAQV